MGNRSSSLKTVLTQDVLLNLAGDRYFARGEDYFRRGFVHDLDLDSDGLTARVSGTEEYYVELWVEDDELQATCTCPLGVDDIFCKHCVAVGLTWLANPSAVKVSKGKGKGKDPAQKPVTAEEVQHFLEQQDKSTLIRWILDRTRQDESWKKQLFLKVASHRPQGIDITTFRRTLRDAIAIRGFIEWNEVSSYVDEIGAVFTSIQDLLENHPQAVIELSEYAISLIEVAMNSVDDSDGELGSILEEFQTLHYEACELGQPDPIALAESLFHGEMSSGFGSFSNAVEAYASILGDEGLAHYRELAESMWEELPTPTPASRESGNWSYQRHKLQRILETLAKADGDIEAVVAIKRQDLSTSRPYLEIAQLYLQDGQPDRALEWAESGLKAFDRSAPGLREFVIEEYHRRGRIEEAMELAWQSFTESVSLYSYQKLKTQAERVNQWETWRDRALTHIRQQLEPAPPPPATKTTQTSRTRKTPQVRSVASSPAWAPWLGRDRSLLVEIFLWEGEDNQAWQEAQAGGCSQTLWLKLAAQRERTHPEDALPIYQQQIEPLIQQTNNTAYANAVSFLKKVHELMMQLNQQTEFNTFVAYLRQTYKAKRNFITMLNQQKW